MTNIDVTGALQRFDGDRDIYRELVETFLETGNADINELKKLYVAGNMTDVCARVHKIKGAALTLGAGELAALTGNLESRLRSGITKEAGPIITEIETLYYNTLEALKSVRDNLRTSS